MFVLLVFFSTLHSVHVKAENSSEFFIQHYVNGCGAADLVPAAACLSVRPSVQFVSQSGRQRLGSLFPQSVRQAASRLKSKRGDMNAPLIEATWSRRQHHCIFVVAHTSG